MNLSFQQPKEIRKLPIASSCRLHLSSPHVGPSLAQNRALVHSSFASFQTVFGGAGAMSIHPLQQLAKKEVTVAAWWNPAGGVKARSGIQIRGGANDGASHRLNCDTPPLVGNCLDTWVSR